ncbi:MAG: helix-turn-helix domain-containing protein [Rhizobiales bacterium]|nr:helix-turn-helix domain-containing protein [Hyphomicrobiales bacterium]
MTFVSIADTAKAWVDSGPLPDGRRRSLAYRRGGEKVRRNSICTGLANAHYRPISRREARQIYAAAVRYDRIGRAKGHRNGPLGHVALEVLDSLCNVICYRTGELQPAYSTLCTKLNRSRDAIALALKSLKAHGFLDWTRRTVRTGAESGPQLKQINNAYRLFLPAIAKAILGRLGKTAPAPVPDDALQAAQDRAREIEAMRATLTRKEQYLLDFADNPQLGETLYRMEMHIIERESGKQGVTVA